MPINVQKALEATRTTTVTFGDESADVTFYPQRVTKDFVRAYAGNGHDPLDTLTEVLAELVVSWDVVDADDVLIPLEEAALAKVPLEILSAVSRAILQEVVPGEAGGATSSSRSSRKGSTGATRQSI
jgi:hypothetical protein